MAKRRKAEQVTRELPGWDQFTKISEGLRDGSDMAAGILGAALVEGYLEELLKARMTNASDKLFQELFNAMGPLNSFSAKIKIAYAFGIISRHLANALENIRQVRNLLAHAKVPLSFSDGIVYNSFRAILRKTDGFEELQDEIDTDESLRSLFVS